jgi:hypothetical protein
MEFKSTKWPLILLLSAFSAWAYLSIQFKRPINYEFYPFLINATTGQTIKPKDYVDLSKVLNTSEAYINSTNAAERLYEIERATIQASPLMIDQTYSSQYDLQVSGWPVADQEKCDQDLSWITGQLRQNESYALIKGRLGLELTQLMDSFGWPEPDAVAWPGSYERCMRASLDGGRIRTRYCWAKWKLAGWGQDELIYPRTVIRTGACLPESCDTLAFERHRQEIDWLAKLNMAKFYRDNLALDSMYCLPDERSPIRQVSPAGYLYLVLVGAWLALVLLGTVLYERVRRRQRKARKRLLKENMRRHRDESKLAPISPLIRNNQHVTAIDGPGEKGPIDEEPSWFEWAKALSIHNSIKGFKQDRFAESEQMRLMSGDGASRLRLDMRCLDAIKFFMAVVVVIGHSGIMCLLSTRHYERRVEWYLSDMGNLGISTARAVDVFFVLYGLLASYTLARKFKVKVLARPLVWVNYNLGVLLRIMPAFGLLYWFNKLIFPYVGSGPWWDYGSYKLSVTYMCLHEPWWKSIPYLSAFGIYPASCCLPISWFLTNYLQLWLIIPLVTLLYYRLPNNFARSLLTCTMCAISCAYTIAALASQNTINERYISSYGLFFADIMEKFESTGSMSAVSRASSVMIGLYTGYLLRRYEVGEIRDWPRWFRRRLSLVAALTVNLLFMFLPLIGNKIAKLSRHAANLHEFIASYIVGSLLFSATTAVLVVLAVTTYSRTALVRFLGHSFWHSANKLGYCIFLAHLSVLFYTLFGYEQSQASLDGMDIAKTISFVLLVSLLLGLLIHILYEAPMFALLHLVIDPLMTKPTKASGRQQPTQDDQSIGGKPLGHRQSQAAANSFA